MVNSPDDDEGDEVPEGPFGGENLPFEQIFASLGIPMPREGEPLDVRRCSRRCRTSWLARGSR